MIEGLNVTVKGPELRELCESRVEHHVERAAVYRGQIASMRAAQVEGVPNMSNGDPVLALESRLKQHENEGREMRFIANHIDTSETYLLDRGDLERLGIVASRY